MLERPFHLKLSHPESFVSIVEDQAILLAFINFLDNSTLHHSLRKDKALLKQTRRRREPTRQDVSTICRSLKLPQARQSWRVCFSPMVILSAYL